MIQLAYYVNKMQCLCSSTRSFFSSFCKTSLHIISRTCFLICCCYRDLAFRINSFFFQLFYFISLSLIGFAILKSANTRTGSYVPRNIDFFFTSVSSVTVSSMSTVEMEVFSNSQLVAMTFLMFLGGEVFTSMVGLHLRKSKIIRTWKSEGRVTSVASEPYSPPAADLFDQIELGAVTVHESGQVLQFQSHTDIFSNYKPFIKHDSIRFLGLVVLGYLLVTHIFGVTSVLIYFSVFPSARDVLRNKGLKMFTFAVFTTVSTFASCGFVPTNENIIIFKRNSGLLWILMPQVLMGNTLFPSCLRFSIWVMGKKFKKAEVKYLLKNSSEIGYLHLLPGLHSLLLAATVFGFIFLGFIIFCALEWNSAALGGLSAYEKVVGVIFQCVNARHTGETIVDLSTIAPAILVFFIILMYLPPYTSFLPAKKTENYQREESWKKRRTGESLILSQLSYIAIFIVLICITERRSLKDDPINFSISNIILEVISAYGNVGFTTGYSCARQVNGDPSCVDKWYGFAGKWSDEGKIVLIAVMIFGRLKKFNMNGGQAWKLM